jgi:hypothetical protein
MVDELKGRGVDFSRPISDEGRRPDDGVQAGLGREVDL